MRWPWQRYRLAGKGVLTDRRAVLAELRRIWPDGRFDINCLADSMFFWPGPEASKIILGHLSDLPQCAPSYYRPELRDCDNSVYRRLLQIDDFLADRTDLQVPAAAIEVSGLVPPSDRGHAMVLLLCGDGDHWLMEPYNGMHRRPLGHLQKPWHAGQT